MLLNSNQINWNPNNFKGGTQFLTTAASIKGAFITNVHEKMSKMNPGRIIVGHTHEFASTNDAMKNLEFVEKMYAKLTPKLKTYVSVIWDENTLHIRVKLHPVK